jgi:hypothetical protein
LRPPQPQECVRVPNGLDRASQFLRESARFPGIIGTFVLFVGFMTAPKPFQSTF